MRRTSLSAGSRSGVVQHALRQHVGHPLVEPHGQLRRVGGAREGVEHVADALRARVGEVEGLPVQAGLVRDVVERGGHEVDRNEVRPADLHPDEREPLRQRAPDLLDRLEEVVGPVDLVHLAGARVADHERRPVHAPRAGGLRAHELLGLELRAVVRRRQRLVLVEHVLGEVTAVLAGHRDGGDVVQDAGLEVGRERDRVARAADVERGVALLVRRHVVDRREVEEVRDAAPQRRARRVVDAEQRLGQIALDRDDAALGAPAGDQLLEPLPRRRAHEGVDGPLAREQALDEVAADEPGRTGHEVVHDLRSSAAAGSPRAARR